MANVVEDESPLNRAAPCAINKTPSPRTAMPSLDFKNKPQSASGTAAFQGDDVGMTPISQFVFDGNVWNWATSASDVPYSGFHVVFADNRNLVPATYTETGSEPEEGEIPVITTRRTASMSISKHRCPHSSCSIQTSIVFRTDHIQVTGKPGEQLPVTLSIRNSSSEPRTFDLVFFRRHGSRII